MLGSKFSVIIVPEDTGQVIEKKVTGWKLAGILAIIVVFAITALSFTIAF
jgi:hypothetical protein